MIQKQAFYKVYSVNQSYITTWSKDVVSEPDFRTVINGGAGELKIQLARPYDNFGEGIDVALQNRVELWIADQDNTANNASPNTLWDVGSWDTDLWDMAIQSFVKIYTGYISAYSPVLDDEKQIIEVTVLGFTSEASKRVIRDASGNTTIAFNSYDPGNIMKGVIDLYRADGGTNINYVGSSINLTGTTVSYTFNDNTLKECLDKIIELCPEGWYWYMDANGVVNLKSQSLTADHKIAIGRDINLMQTNKRIENMINVVYLIGGGATPLFRRYIRQTSVNTYGKFEAKITDGRVTDTATADIMAKSLLDRYDTPETRSVIRIIDNNGDNRNEGQNIESYQVGDTVQVQNLNYGTTAYSSWDTSSWDVDVWDATLNYSQADVMVIVSIQYNLDSIEIEASSRLPEVTKRVEDVKRNMDTLAQQNLPTAPTSTSI